MNPTPTSSSDYLPAGLARRLGAMLYDSLLVFALWLTTLIIFVAVAEGAVEGPLLQSFLLLETYAFFAFFWLRRRETLGMLAWRLQVHPNTPNTPLSLTQVTLRFIGAILGCAALGLGYLWILVDSEKRSWSDLLSDSRILVVPNRFDEPQ